MDDKMLSSAAWLPAKPGLSSLTAEGFLSFPPPARAELLRNEECCRRQMTSGRAVQRRDKPWRGRGGREGWEPPPRTETPSSSPEKKVKKCPLLPTRVPPPPRRFHPLLCLFPQTGAGRSPCLYGASSAFVFRCGNATKWKCNGG